MRGIVALLCALSLAKADPVRRNIASYDESDPTQAPLICATEKSEGILVAHEICNKFYQCWDGKPIARDCYRNLHYNPITEVCDWPEKVECGSRIIPEDTSSNENENEVNEDDHGGNGGSGAGNCDPSQASAICARQGSDGTFVAHENCNKYYICDNGVPVDQKCPGNLLFDPLKDYCDWPESVVCGDRTICEESEEIGDIENGGNDNNGNVGTGAGNCDPSQAGNICAAEGSDGVLVAHENCNKYYICSHGVPTIQSCPGNLLFDPFKDYCDWAVNVDCGDRVISEASNEDTNDTENGDSGNGGSGSTGAGNCDPSQAGNICAAAGSDGVLVAHENCNKYYICSHGVPTVQKCPGNLLFDPFKDYCDWAVNVDCGDRVISEASNEDANDIENGDTGNGGSGSTGAGNCDPSQAGNMCAAAGSDGVLVAHENCNKYYICSHGVPTVQKCPGNLLFDPFKDYCDWAVNVNCGDRVISEASNEDANDTENGDTGNGGSGSTGAGNCDPSQAGNICAAAGSDGVLVAHENCNKYYICSHGVPTVQKCPGNLLFDPFKDYCDWLDNVDCGVRVIPDASNEDTNDTENEDIGSAGNGNGDTDNEVSGTCNCNPGEAPAICAADGSDNTLVAHENCNQFYTCAAGQPVTLTCPGSTLYNPYTEQCDWPENVQCGERVIPEVDSEDTDNENEETDTVSSENGGPDNGETDNGESGTCNCNPGEAPAICAADGSDNTLVAHENCNQFYTCAAGQPVALTCPGSTLYNPYTQQCDWPENVECDERIIPEVNSEENDGENGDTDTDGADNGGSDNGGADNGGSGTCNCSPGEAPAICAADGSDNTLVAHENCNQFYTCAAGQPLTLTCPGSTLYNPYTQQCDWPESVKCDERVIPEVNSEENDGENGDTDTDGADNGGSDNGGADNGGSGTCNCNPGEAPAICAADGSDNTLVAHENCNQFYTCAAGQPVTLTCPGSTLYNPYTQQCDWPENVECGERVIPEVDSEDTDSGNEETDTDSSENGGTDNGGTDNGESGTCNCNPGEAPAICAADGSDNTFVAHENCNQFYTCAAGQPVTLTCPGSTLYNPYTQQCDWTENVECGERVIPEIDSEETDNGNEETDTDSSENGGPDNGETDNGESGTCNCNPEEAPAICAADGSDNTLVAHENCNQFYTCAAGQPVTLTCPGSTLYNPNTKQCDWPENVECGERIIPEVDSEDTDSGNEETDTDGADNGGSDNGGADNGGSGTCNCNPGEAPTICAADGSDNTFVAHENCNQFYACAAGQPVTVTCPGSTLYNPYTQQCDWPANVECGERVIPETDSEDTGNGNEETDTDSSENGGSDNGEADNGGSGTCNCNPGEAPAICAADGSDNTFVAHENCNQFYTCAAGQPVTVTCPGSTLYNPYTQQCDWPENVECGERVIPEIDSEETDNGNEETDTDSSENGGPDSGGTDNGESGTCNCNPGEAPAICAADGSDNTLVAHENCNQFYTCASGQPVTVTCPGSTLYNPYTQQCDWPENVECGERVIPEIDSEDTDNGNEETDTDTSENGGPDNGGTDNGGSGTCNCNPGEAPAICAADGSDNTLVAHENCNQFYTCAAGQPVTVTCAGSTLYNPYTQQCDWPENVECGERVIPETDSEDTDNGNEETDTDSSENGGSDNGEADNGGFGTCNCNPGEAPAICAADGSDNTFIAHENCNQFYTCAAGQPVTVTCPGFTLYNPYTQQCDWPENVECGERIIPETDSEDTDNGNEESDTDSSDNGGSDNGEADNGGSGACNCNPGEANAICAADGSDNTFVAHENCNQFYTCVAGQPATLTCPGSTLYNPYTQQCDWPENVECGERVIPEVDSADTDNESEETDTDSSDNGEPDNGGTDNGGSGTCNCNPGEAPAICAADGSDGRLVAHENCNKFYTCVGGQPATLTCPGSLLYNPYTQQCDWPENVECGERVIPEVDSGNTDNENEDTDTDSSENGEPDNGGTDNGGSGTCNCNPGEAPAICVADGSDGTLVAHENCNKFYTCVGGQPATLTCPGSLLYNPYTQQCDWPENVECGERVIPEVDNEENDNENGETESGGSDNGGSDNGGSGSCNCDPGEAPAICAADGSDGTFVAHENCNKFYTCVGGEPATLTCAGSLLYNPFTQICDWPENVECGERIIPEEDCKENDNENGETESGGSDNGDSDNGGSDSCNCNPGEAPAICAADGSEGILVAHENCNQFYTCVGGQPATLTCPGSLLYNPYTQICDWPENVECGERIIPEEDCEENDNENGETESGGSDNGDSDNGGSDSCNCNPGEAPAICAADGSEGILVAHENCNQFYTCVGGQPATLTCPGSLLYNPYTQICDWPENVECGERIIPEEDCEENDNGNGETEIDSTESGGSDNDGSDNGGSGSCNCNPGEAPAICATDGSDGILVAHVNCNQFYTCVGSHPATLTCPGSLLYDPYTQKCNWPENVDCGDRVNPEIECEEENENERPESGSTESVELENGSSENVDNGGSDNGSGSEVEDIDNDSSENGDNGGSDGENTCNCNPDEASAICAAYESDGIMVAHKNCNQFYTCLEGQPITLTCTGTTLYNPYTQRCDWPDNVSCGNRTNSDSDNSNENSNDGEDENSEDGNSDVNDSNDSGSLDIDAVLKTCGKSDSEGIFLPHEKCNQFYVCIGNEPVIMSCSGNLLYNYEENRCDWPENVNCGTRIIPSEDGAVPEVEADDIRIVDVHDDKGEGTKPEPEPEYESEFGFEVAVTRCTEDNSAGVMVPHEECHRFYICVSNRPVVFTCTSDNLYDIELQQCNYPQNVNCGNRLVRTV